MSFLNLAYDRLPSAVISNMQPIARVIWHPIHPNLHNNLRLNGDW
mgnify:CR=1 FL=1